MKIYYDYTTEFNFDLETYVKPCLKNSPDWFKKLSPLVENTKSPLELLKTVGWDYVINSQIFTTSKRCPAFLNLFSNSLLLTFPNDIIIETFENGSVNYKSADESLIVKFHNPAQVDGHLRNNFIMIKFSYAAFISQNKNTKYSFVDPIYYKKQPYTLAPGIMDGYKNEATFIDVITLFEKKDEVYYFNAGEPLALLQSSEKISSFNHNPMQEKMNKHRRKFNKFDLKIFHKK